MSEQVVAPSRSRAAVRQAWVERFDRFAAAGLPVNAFCRCEGISTQAFYYWKQKLAAQAGPATAASPRLLPVHLDAATPVEVVLPQGVILRLGPGCDLAFVRSVVEALGGAVC